LVSCAESTDWGVRPEAKAVEGQYERVSTAEERTFGRRSEHDEMVILRFPVFDQFCRLVFRALEGELEAPFCLISSNAFSKAAPAPRPTF
jgi:hypothetical protein